MKRISIIGTCLLDEILISEEMYKEKGCNKMQLSTSFGGSMHNVAWNCSTMDINCSFFTILGNDEYAKNAVTQLEEKNCHVFFKTINKSTPRFYTFHHPNKSQIFSTITDDFYYSSDDFIDYSVLNESDLCITDNDDNDFLKKCIENTPNTKWIISRNVPDVSLLNKVEGIILNEWELYRYDEQSSNEQSAKKIIDSGCPWLIVTLSSEGVLLYTKNNALHLPVNKEASYQYALGCGDALLSGLVYGLLQNYSIEESLSLGNKAASLNLSTPVALSENIKKIKNH